MGMLPRTPLAELQTENGAACFGPNTALLIQDPLDWTAHAPVETLTLPIGSLKYGDTVLAENHGQFFSAKVKCVMTFEIPQAMDPAANRTIQENTLTTGMGFTLTKHHHTRNYGQIHRDTQGRWQLTSQADNMQWMVAADLSRHPTCTRHPHTFPVTRVFNLVLDPPGNVVILTPNHKVYISASLGYHMRYGNDPDDRTQQTGGIPVYTRGDALQLQRLPEFERGLIQWGQGAVTRANDGRLAFDWHKVIRRGHNLFLGQPLETLSNIIDTLPATEDNMWRLQRWRQVCKSWKLHIDSYTGPEGHWQRNLRIEIHDLWLSLYRRAIALVQNDATESMKLGPHAVLALLSCDLGKALKLFGFSRALVGGVALIISILTRPNDQSHVTLGPHVLMEVDFLMHERNVLQSLLVAGLSRHGLVPTPLHSSRTGPCNTPPGATDTYLDTLPRPQDYPDPIPPRLAPSSRTQTLFPIFHNPPLARTEAQRRGLDILQILHASCHTTFPLCVVIFGTTP